MHSSRMRTGRSLTVSWRLLPGGCLPGLGGCLPGLGGCLPGLGGVCLVRGVSAWSGGCLPGPGGVCLVWGVSAWSGGCLPGLGGLPGPAGCLPGPGGSAWSGGLASHHALRQTPPLWTESQTPVKTLPWQTSLGPVITGLENYRNYRYCLNRSLGYQVFQEISVHYGNLPSFSFSSFHLALSNPEKN